MRGGAVSARAVVRPAQRIVCKEQWTSFQIRVTKSFDSVSIRVHRATLPTEPASLEPSASSGAKKAEQEEDQSHCAPKACMSDETLCFVEDREVADGGAILPVVLPNPSIISGATVSCCWA